MASPTLKSLFANAYDFRGIRANTQSACTNAHIHAVSCNLTYVNNKNAIPCLVPCDELITYTNRLKVRFTTSTTTTKNNIMHIMREDNPPRANPPAANKYRDVCMYVYIEVVHFMRQRRHRERERDTWEYALVPTEPKWHADEPADLICVRCFFVVVAVQTLHTTWEINRPPSRHTSSYVNVNVHIIGHAHWIRNKSNVRQICGYFFRNKR